MRADRRHRWAVGAAVGLALVLVAPPHMPATGQEPAAGDPRIDHHGSDDGIGTAVAVSAHGFRDGADVAVLARADDHADALSASVLAADRRGPILLTPPDHLDRRVADELRRLGAREVVFAGGERALAHAIVRQVQDVGASVVRVFGATRYETAARIAVEVNGSPDGAYLALGAHPDPSRAWPDAVAVGALAARQGRPILLTEPQGLPAATADALQALGRPATTLVGGTAAIGSAVQDDVAALGVAVQRLGGSSRLWTSIAIADADVAAGADRSAAWIVSSGRSSDALVAAPVAALQGQPLILGDAPRWRCEPAHLWLRATRPSALVVVGGAALADAVRADAGAGFPFSTCGRVALVVHDPAALNTAEAALRGHLAAAGAEVVVVDDADPAVDAPVVVISKTVASTTVGRRFRDTGAGVVLWEDNLQRRSLMGLLGSDGEGGTNWHRTGDAVTLAAGVPTVLAGGLTGTVPFYAEPHDVSYGPDVPSTATVVATMSDAPHHAAVYAYERGSILGDGAPTAGRRVYFGLYDDSFHRLSPQGLALFEAAVGWAGG